MENKENILQELQQISQAVATIGNRNVYSVPAGYFDGLAEEVVAKLQLAPLQALPNPFAVPEGYFDSLAGNIMDKIRARQKTVKNSEVFEELQGIAPLLNTISKQMPYSIPEGYFQQFSVNINAAQQNIAGNTEVFTELEEIAPLLNTISRQMPYSVPEGYFETLSVSIPKNSEVYEELQGIAPLLNTISKQMPYSVPEGYFEILSVNIPKTTEVFEELQEIAPLLNTISKQMPYSVPEGYFEQFTVNVNTEAPVVEITQAKVITMHGSRSKWVTYLAAACVTVLLGIGAFVVTQRQGNPAATAVNIDQQLASLSDDDINNYLDNDPSTGAEALPSSLDDQSPDIQPFIQNMSNDEIQQYLKENSSPDEKRTKDI